MHRGYGVLTRAATALALLGLFLVCWGAKEVSAAENFVSANGLYRLTLPEGWSAVQGEEARLEVMVYKKMRPFMEHRLPKLNALFKLNKDVGGVALFVNYPAKARSQGVTTFWNQYVASIRMMDKKYAHKDLKHQLGFADRNPYLRQTGPEPSLGLFMSTTRYRLWDGVLILRFFCPWGQGDQWRGQFEQIADSIKFTEKKDKSRYRGF